MASQQPPGESKTINISTKQYSNCFTTTSWRIQNNKYFNKQISKWLHNSLLENPKPSAQMASQQHPGESKPSIFKQTNAQMVSQQPPGESKTITI